MPRHSGLRIGGFGYSTDAVRLDDAAFAALAGVDTWVVGCFRPDPASDARAFRPGTVWAARVGARRTVLTHMGTDMDWAWMIERMPPGMTAGYDGLVLAIPD